MKIFWILIFSVLLISALPHPKSIVLKAQLSKKNIKTRKDLDIKLTLINFTNKSLCIKERLNVDYCNMFDTQICFEVEKYGNSVYKQIDGCANIDRIPIFDSLGNILYEDFSYVHPNDSIVKEYNPMKIFCFSKGKYRLRVYFKFESFSETMELFAKSDWVYFDVQPDYVSPF